MQNPRLKLQPQLQISKLSLRIRGDKVPRASPTTACEGPLTRVPPLLPWGCVGSALASGAPVPSEPQAFGQTEVLPQLLMGRWSLGRTKVLPQLLTGWWNFAGLPEQ